MGTPASAEGTSLQHRWGTIHLLCNLPVQMLLIMIKFMDEAWPEGSRRVHGHSCECQRHELQHRWGTIPYTMQSTLLQKHHNPNLLYIINTIVYIISTKIHPVRQQRTPLVGILYIIYTIVYIIYKRFCNSAAHRGLRAKWCTFYKTQKLRSAV